MGIAISCPRCGSRMEFSDSDAGRTGQCISCQSPVQIPLRLKPCPGCQRMLAVEMTACPACGAALAVDPGVMPVMPGMTPHAMELSATQTSKKAVASLLLGLMSVLFVCFTGVPAVILGALALGDIRRSSVRMGGRGAATAGIVVGSLASLCGVPIMLALLLPAVQSAREAARRTQCRNNLREIGLALHSYHAVWGSFPPACSRGPKGEALLSWRVLILPYLDQQMIYDQFQLDEAWDSPNNLALIEMMPDVFRCASDASQSPYVAITGHGTVFPPDRATRISDIVDGASHTAMVGERHDSGIVWTKPDDALLDEHVAPATMFPTKHAGGWNMLMVDGAVQFIRYSIDPTSCRNLMTINGGEVGDSL